VTSVEKSQFNKLTKWYYRLFWK